MFTLQGIFPTPPKEGKKNFIKENVRQLRLMQNTRTNPENAKNKKRICKPRFDHLPQILDIKATGKAVKEPSKIKASLSMNVNINKREIKVQKNNTKDYLRKRKVIDLQKVVPLKEISKIEHGIKTNFTFRDVGCQYVEPNDEEKKIGDGHTKIIYPSKSILEKLDKESGCRRQDMGDGVNNNNLDLLETKDVGVNLTRLDNGTCCKSNECLNVSPDRSIAMMSKLSISSPERVGALTKNCEDKVDPLLPPPSYKVGAVPQYLRTRRCLERQQQRQAELQAAQPQAPPGHVFLTEQERTTTLSILKDRFSVLVKELNHMPVRSDTLRMKTRKMLIDKELSKLEEDIKIFSRPKVLCQLEA